MVRMVDKGLQLPPSGTRIGSTTLQERGSDISPRVCTKCVLPETFPGIHFDAKGVCNFCSAVGAGESHRRGSARFRRKFEELVKENKGKSCYDAIMCYSGGKDSTYTLRILKEDYDLRVLALTFDNGFVADQTRKNIESVVERLGVDHEYFKPRFDMLSQIFRSCADRDVFPAKTAERASMICTACMSIVKFSALRIAVEKKIPLVAFGWSPGQAPITSSIMKNNPSMVRVMQKVVYDPLYKLAGDEIRPYFLEDEQFADPARFPHNVHPLAFLNYSEEEIYRCISSLGWKAPKDVDPNSTNCLLNSFGNVIHKQRFRFHPYAFELAGLVREGYLDREVALERLQKVEDQAVVDWVKDRLGVR
jgi:tRNA(Ile)-lysidine synthase TilS/MesJ